jgi:hypothetical protein
MALETITICRSIADLVVDGVTIKNIDEIPADCTRLIPVLYPEPLNFVSDFTMERDSFGGGSTAKMRVEYTLTYTFCLAPIASGRTGLEYYSELVDKVADILHAFLSIDVLEGVEDIVPLTPVEFGPVFDPSGNIFIGCKFPIRVMEFVN